jgi:signal transduction histidine kinase
MKPPLDQYQNLSKESEECIRNPETFYCKVIENANGIPFQLLYGSQIGEGHYLKVGSGVKQLLNIEPEDFTEKLFYSIIEKIVPLSEDIPADIADSRNKLINGELKRYKAEILINTPGGEKKWIRETSLPLIEEVTGKVIGACGIFFDITEYKQILYDLEKSMKRAEESDRLKSAFLHNISHEIRTPLNAIVGFSALLSEYENDSEQRKKCIDTIILNTDHLLEIMNNIVEVSNIDADTIVINKESVNINSVLQGAYNRLTGKALEKNLSLILKTPNNNNEIKIRTDRFKLQQVLLNLIENAIKFTTEGRIEYGCMLNDNNVEFFVSDTGIGISEEHHNKIFNRFYQAENNYSRIYEGAGLGLSISKAYVELLGGKIRVFSQPGKGSTFYFTLPYDNRESE